MSLADEFGQWKQSKPVEQTPVVQEVVQEEKPFWERAKDDIVNTVSNYLEGAQQGINELGRAQDAQYGNDLAQITSEQGYQPPTPQQHQYLADAQKAVMDETVLPTLALNPATMYPAIGTMLMSGAKNTYENTEGDTLDKAGNAVRAITYGPAVDMYNDPNLGQRFYDRPVTTAVEGALGVGQALLPIYGAKRGIAKAGEFKTDLARIVDEKLNTITENPPLENIGIRGLDALDQIDSPTRGFRPATPDEAIQYNTEQRSAQGQNLLRALEELKQQKFDQTEGITPEPRFPERQQQQALLQALERAKVQKFDEANQQSYFNDMARQERESNALQAKKNEIASSVLMNPLDRMEVGADVPIKRSLGGQGKVLGENITPSILELPKPKQAIPQRVMEQPKKIPDAFDLVNRVQIKLFDQRLKDAVNKRNYPLAEQLADRMAKEGIETPLSKSVQSQKGGNRLYAGLDPTFGKFDNVSIGDIGNKAFEKVAERIWNSEGKEIKETTNGTFKKWFGNSKIVDETGRPIVTYRGLSQRYDPSVSRDITWVTKEKEVADSYAFGGTTHQTYVKIEKPYHINKFDTTEISVSDFMKNIVQFAGREMQKKNLDRKTAFEIKDMLDKFDNDNRVGRVYNMWDLYPEVKIALQKMGFDGIVTKNDTFGVFSPEQIKSVDNRGTYDKTNRNMLYSGLDPTGGRFDNVDLGAKAKEYAGKIKDRIVSTSDDGRIIDNNRSVKLPSIKKTLDRAYQQVFDSLDPIARYDKEVYKSARLASGAAIGKAESIIRNKNNPMSFENITKPVHERLDDFAEYMVAVRAKELHNNGIGTGISNTRIDNIIANAPREFADVQKQLTSYSDNLVKTLVDSGVISEEHAMNMFNKYESYTPMMRAFDVEEISKMFRDKGDLGKPIQTIEGSDAKVINPIESILKNTYTFNMIAETNKVRQQIASLAESFPDEIKILKNGEAAEKGTGTFDFFVDGKKMTMQLEPRLFEAIASMDSQQASIVVTVLSKPASWLRAGATLSPEFMAKNLIRDTIGAGIVGKDFTPFVDSVRGLKSAWTKDADYWRYKEEGGALGHLTGLDRDHMQEMVNNYRSKSKAQKLATTFNPKTWVDILRKGQELSEDATRIGYYKKRLSKGDSPRESAFEARDLLDFGRSGNYTREWNKVSAFLNASLQGTDKLVRTMKARPLETSVNLMKYLIMPSMAVWYMGKDNKDIQELPRYVRDMFWVVPAGDKLIRIPKPFEAGVIFATGTERTLEAMYGDSKSPYKGYGKSLWEVTLPNLLPTSLVPLGEWWANKSLFTGNSIVPMKEQSLPDEMQYGAFTTNTAKYIGSKTGTSPRKIDNTIRSLTGGFGTGVTSTIDTLTGGNGTIRPTPALSDKPIIKAFIADPRKSQQSTEDFYDELETYTKKYQASKQRNVKMSPVENRNYQQLNNANTALKALNKQERAIIESNKLTPDQKREKLDKIIDAQTKLVQAALKRIK